MVKRDDNKKFNISIQVIGLDAYTNRILNTLAKLRGIKKADIMKEALVFYAETRSGDIEELAKPREHK